MQPGAEQLREWMHRRGFNQRDLTDFLGEDEATVSRLLSGKQTPGLSRAVRLERLTGIPVEAWVSDIVALTRTPKRTASKQQIAKV